MRFLWLLIAGLILWQILHKTIIRKNGKVVCRNCGTVEFPKTVSPRNVWVEVILWFSYLIPGVLYTLWCNHQTYDACNKCSSRDIVPLDSPIGRKLAAQQSPIDVTPISEHMGHK